MVKIPASINFDMADKKLKLAVSLDSKDINFNDGIQGSIDIESVGPGLEAVYGCLIRKENIAVTSNLTKSRQGI